MSKIKLCHIVTAFPRDESDDNMTPWLIDLIREQQNLGIDVVVYVQSYKGLSDHTIWGINVKRYRYLPSFLELLSHNETMPVQFKRKPFYLLLVPFSLIAGFIKFWRYSRQEHFDIVHIHWPFPMGLIGFATKSPKVLSFYTAELIFLRKFGAVGKWLLKKIVKKSKSLIAISSHAAKHLTDIVPGIAVDIIPYGYRFPKQTPSIHFPEKRPVKILFVGRLVPRKGVEYLVDAMPLLENKVDIHLYIVGDGALMESLDAQVEKLGIGDKVDLTGRVSSEKLEEYYRNCDILVLPAVHDEHGDTEGLGMVLVEALARGKPVIASSVGGIVDIVKDNKTGLLVREKEPQAIADAIYMLASDKELYTRLAKDGFKYVSENFATENIARKTIETYENILKNDSNRKQMK